MVIRYLCVAEKPSISKSVTQILSGGQFNTRQTSTAWIKNYDFTYRLPPSPALVEFTVTAVAGHLMSSEFTDEHRGWSSCDPSALFDAPIVYFVPPDKKGIEKNLLVEARKVTHLMIWTDCDREGEHIGSEIVEICRKANPRIIVTRARFSAIIANQIHAACRNTVPLDLLQANAVAARIDLDLRLGALFTRTQTLGLQALFPELESKVISYGPCQFPTLGFVVDQYERVQAFIPEDFWYIQVTLVRDESSVTFNWRRGKLFDYEVAQVFFSLCEDEPEAMVIQQQKKPTQKWKPLPLTTVELQKTGSRLLHMPPKRILEIADSLYGKGILSYPRTETDQFDKDFDFNEMISKHTGDDRWGDFAQGLMNGAFERPRNGKNNDKAHPPIHPTSHAGNLDGDDKRVYELITRRFLACCSTNAKGMETTVEIEIAEEGFTTKGLVILERNYLDVYVYDKWNGNLLPHFQAEETFMPTSCDLKAGKTTQPNLLTEADLVSLMDKNGIGTDATIAEHISKIIDREYVMKRREGRIEYLVPSTLGIGLVEGYNAIGFDKSLTKPHLRRQTEHRMKQVCDGQKLKQDMIGETLDEYREIYAKTKQSFDLLVNSVRRYINPDGEEEDDPPSDDDDDHAPPPPNAGVGRGGARGRGAPRGAVRGRGRGGGAAPARRRDDDDEDQDDGHRRPGGGAIANIPSCRCEVPAVERTVMKESANKGKKFFTCSKGQGEGCGFFEWSEGGGIGGGGGGNVVPQKRAFASGSTDNNRNGRYQNQVEEGTGDRCKCDLTPALRTTTKEGPNQGRKFFVCPNVSKSAQCNHFAWQDEGAPAPAGREDNANRRGGAARYSAGPCDLCEDDDHDAAHCPMQIQGAGAPARNVRGGRGRGRGGARGGGGGGGGGGQTGECFICNQEGHWSSNCPNKNGGGGGGGGGRGGGGGGGGAARVYSCFKCGEEGHFSNACTNENQGGGGDRGRGRGGGSGAGWRGRGGGARGGRGRGY